MMVEKKVFALLIFSDGIWKKILTTENEEKKENFSNYAEGFQWNIQEEKIYV
jgi:hypothetical protein